MTTRCCYIPCEAVAEFVIYGGESGAPDDATEACEAHVGALLGSPMTGPENRSWTVVVLGDETVPIEPAIGEYEGKPATPENIHGAIMHIFDAGIAR